MPVWKSYICNSCVARDSSIKLKEGFLNKHLYVPVLCRDKLNSFELTEEKLNCVLGLHIFFFFSTRALLSMALASCLMCPFCPILRCLHVTLSIHWGFLHTRIGFQALHCRLPINSETKSILDISSSFFFQIISSLDHCGFILFGLTNLWCNLKNKNTSLGLFSW